MGVLSTGDELVEPSVQALGPGQIRDANRCMLAAAARAAGCEVVDLGIARDDMSQASGQSMGHLPASTGKLLCSFSARSAKYVPPGPRGAPCTCAEPFCAVVLRHRTT